MAIHTSIGTSTADSYVSVSYANTYFNERIFSDTWLNIASNSTSTLGTVARKENLLKQATREIDRALRFHENKYYLGDIGADDYQALQFPRSSNIDADGALYVPDEIKDATCEQALWIMERGGKRTDANGLVIDRQLISGEALGYIGKWSTRLVQPYNQYPWKGSEY
jgi:hypothetical protein